MISAAELLITSSVLILVLLLLRLLLQGKISCRFQYSLWALAALRLLLPFSLPTGSSWMDLPDIRQAESIATGQTALAQAAGGTAHLAVGFETGAGAAKISPLLILWFVGALIAAAWFLIVNLRFAHRLRTMRCPLAGGRPIPVYQVAGLASPCLFGSFHPAIYVPVEMTDDPAMLRHILMHEESHWRQKDHIWALVRIACLCLYWFDPLVWIAAAVSREDCERACDERTIQGLGEPERIAYGHTLISVVRKMRRPVYPGCTATAMSAGKHSLQRRISLIVTGARTRTWAMAAMVVCIAALVGCTFTSRTNDPSRALTELENSITVSENVISFTLPESYAPASDWNILIYGRADMGGSGMSVHFLESENADHSWQAGQTYIIELGDAAYLSLQMDASLPGEDAPVLTVDLLSKAGIE